VSFIEGILSAVTTLLGVRHRRRSFNSVLGLRRAGRTRSGWRNRWST